MLSNPTHLLEFKPRILTILVFPLKTNNQQPIENLTKELYSGMDINHSLVPLQGRCGFARQGGSYIYT